MLYFFLFMFSILANSKKNKVEYEKIIYQVGFEPYTSKR